jgi:Rrf2 family protein
MKFLTRETDYSLRALVFIARRTGGNPGMRVSVDEIVNSEGVPRVFMRRLLQTLAREGILLSYKGKGGGFAFAKPPAKVRITDIVRVFQGPVDLTSCFLRGFDCPNIRKCKVRKKLKEYSRFLERELGKISIASLL